VEFFNDAILQLFDGHVPLRRGCRKSNFNQWFNSEIEMAIVNRNLVYRSWKLERTTEFWAIYKRFRNSVNDLVRQAKHGSIFGPGTALENSMAQPGYYWDKGCE
jgi:hypothetical protein